MHQSFNIQMVPQKFKEMLTIQIQHQLQQSVINIQQLLASTFELTMQCVVLNFNFMTHQKTIIIGLLQSVLILTINIRAYQGGCRCRSLGSNGRRIVSQSALIRSENSAVHLSSNWCDTEALKLRFSFERTYKIGKLLIILNNQHNDVIVR